VINQKYSAKPRKPWLKIFAITAVIVGLLVLGAVFLVRRAYYENLKPLNQAQKSEIITVPAGSSLREIAQLLQEQKLIRSNWAFEWYVNSQDARGRLQAGTYALKPSQSVQEIVAALTQGKINTDLITILPGQRLDQIRDGLINDGFSPAEVDAALNPKLYAAHPALADKPASASLEGYLYPESFQKSATTDPEEIVRASLDQMRRYLTPEVRTGLVRQGLTVHEGVTLASIVEQEVGHVDQQKDLEDKKKVAQVFLRRLKEDKALESDATANYGAVLADALPSLSFESAYNTYQNKNLPPGPISNVARNSLLAVANPAKTDFLFFVSGDRDDNGISKTHFSRTLEEHEANVRQYCTKACANPE